MWLDLFVSHKYNYCKNFYCQRTDLMYTEEQLSTYMDELQNLAYEDSIKFLEKNKNTENFDHLLSHIYKKLFE